MGSLAARREPQSDWTRAQVAVKQKYALSVIRPREMPCRRSSTQTRERNLLTLVTLRTKRHCRTDYLFQVEVPFVDPFDLVAHFQAHADVVLDHQARQFFTVDQDDAFRTTLHIVLSRPGETGGSDEHSLHCAGRIDRPSEVAQGAFAHSVAISIFFGLKINLVQTERVFPDRTIDSTVSRTPGDLAHRIVAVAIAHGNHQVHHHLFEKRRGRLTNLVQNVRL